MTKNKCDGDHEGYWILIGIFALIAFGVIVWHWGYGSDIKELGGAICEEEYGMDYDSYYQDELKCKDVIAEEEYDGLKVIIKDGGTE